MGAKLLSLALAAVFLAVDSKKFYGSRPSGGSSGSRPSGGSSSSFFSPSASKPNSSPSASTPNFSPSASRPNPSPSFSRPTAPTRPSFQSPSGPVSPTSRSPYNPSPAYKPLSPAGAPTVRSGGGGFGSTAKTVFKVAAVGIVAAVAINIAAGYFLYGGRHSSPYCRGDDQDRFASGRCPRGTSSQAHACKTNIPLCVIPEVTRGRWNFGGNALPKVDVRFDRSVCSIAALPVTSSNFTTTANATDATTTAINTNTTPAKVEGESGLNDCLVRITAAGGCASQGIGNLFLYDDATDTCGCCSSPQITTLDAFSSAVYSHRTDDLREAPKHCISGSILYYPDLAGVDVPHSCECGSCTTCGGGGARYLDWSGPFVVPDAVGGVSFLDAAKTQPRYDPVDTCLCDDVTLGQCESDFAASQYSAGPIPGHPSNLIALSAAVVFFLHYLRRD